MNNKASKSLWIFQKKTSLLRVARNRKKSYLSFYKIKSDGKNHQPSQYFKWWGREFISPSFNITKHKMTTEKL